jgi:hypothetical protein
MARLLNTETARSLLFIVAAISAALLIGGCRPSPEAERDDYRFSALVQGIVDSAPFGMRMVQPDEQVDVAAVAARGD